MTPRQTSSSPLGYGRPARTYHVSGDPMPRPRWVRRTLLAIGVTIGVSAVVFATLPARLGYENTNAGHCLSNLHQIGLAMELYQMDHPGPYPPTFDGLLQNEQITAEVFVCPGSDDEKATVPANDPPAGDVLTAGHCSYVFAAAGLLPSAITAGTVVAYESHDNHGQGTFNLLFGDGHAEAVPTARALPLIAAARAIPRPQPPTTRPGSPSRK